MSVIANQMQTIQEAILTSQQSILFNGASLKVDGNHAIFVTLAATENVNGFSKMQ